MAGIVHRDVMQLKATPEQVLEFVLTPERIADYFPGYTDCGSFEEGRSIWCSGKSGVSLLELLEEESSSTKVTVKVYNANVKPPYSVEAIKSAAFMTMVEDWEVEAVDGGTRLTKTWRDVVKYRMKWLPMGLMIRMTARGEHGKLVEGWNRAAGTS